MTTKNFLASCAKATFALAAVVMMSAVLTSCSKDNDDEPTPQLGTVTIDGKEKPILKARYLNAGAGLVSLFLLLSKDGKEEMFLLLDKEQHINTKPISLDDDKNGDKVGRVIAYYNPRAPWYLKQVCPGIWSIIPILPPEPSLLTARPTKK
ncbi:hypothetical protein [Hoylesella saccharolytica]|uniref:hypothetical protein n=1 Tax=Hoylesella saccharolytica TaxID=633701 RepID=UPI00046F4039|nr:hypothetical protein [Hoylesella saccharolytica]